MDITKNQLIDAVKNNDIELVKATIHNFKNTNFSYKIGNYYLLELALLYKNSEIAQLLIDNGANIQSFEIMRICFQTKQFSWIEKLIEKGFDIHQKSPQGETLIMCAAHYGVNDYIEKLMGLGMNLFAQDKHGSNTLDYALNYPQINSNFIEKLLEVGVPCSNFALRQAIKNQNIEVVKIILENSEKQSIQEMMNQSYFFDYEVNKKVIEFILKTYLKEYEVDQKRNIHLIKNVHSYDESEKENLIQRLELLKQYNLSLDKKQISEVLNYYIYETPLFFEKNAKYQLISDLTHYFIQNDYQLQKHEIDFLLNHENLNPILTKAPSNTLHQSWREIKNFDDVRNHPSILNLIKLNINLSLSEQGKFLQTNNYSLINAYLDNKKDKDLESSLINIILNQEIKIEEKILLIDKSIALGADINIKMPLYEQNLFFITREPEVAQHLIDLGLDYHALSSWGHNVLSSNYIDEQLLDFWQQKGLDINQYSEETETNVVTQKILDGEMSLHMLFEYINHGAQIEDDIIKENFSSSYDKIKTMQEKYLLEHSIHTDNVNKTKIKI